MLRMIGFIFQDHPRIIELIPEYTDPECYKTEKVQIDALQKLIPLVYLLPCLFSGLHS